MACVIAKKDFGLPTHPHFECTSINTDEIFIELSDDTLTCFTYWMMMNG